MNKNYLTVEKMLEFSDSNVWFNISAETAIILSLTIFFHLLLIVAFKRIKILLKKNQHDQKFNWYIEIISGLQSPALKSLWIFSIAFIAENLCEHMKFPIVNIISNIKVIALILMLSRAILKAIDSIEEDLVVFNNKGNNNLLKVDRVTIDIASKLFKAIIYVIGGLAFMHSLGVNINSVLAVGGISGLAIGLASKDLLSNFFGTIMIYLDRPFIIGELVKIGGTINSTGTVEKVDWRVTTIRTSDKTQLFVPNSIFSTTSIENASRISHRVFKEEISIACQEHKRIINIISDIRNFLERHDGIDNSQGIEVDIIEISQNIIKLKIKCFSNVINFKTFGEIRNNILIEIVNIIKDNELDLAVIYKAQ